MNKSSTVLTITLWGLVILRSAASPIAETPTENCDRNCPDNVSPVCASDGNENRMFINDCHMNAYNCWEKREFRVVNADQCNDGESVSNPSANCPLCPNIWAPVCGSDGFDSRTFASECFMEATNCLENKSYERMKLGLCEGVDILGEIKKPCRPCTRIYEPVCGFDGVQMKSFPNKCELESINCRESQNFYMMKEGDC